MKYLLDTNVLLWFLGNDDRLPPAHRRTIEDPETDVLVSIATLWEISIKSSLGKLVLAQGLPTFLDAVTSAGAFDILNISVLHLKYLHGLPFLHRDPFDRIIIAQSKAERLGLLYTDAAFTPYLKLPAGEDV